MTSNVLYKFWLLENCNINNKKNKFNSYNAYMITTLSYRLTCHLSKLNAINETIYYETPPYIQEVLVDNTEIYIAVIAKKLTQNTWKHPHNTHTHTHIYITIYVYI